MDKIIRLVTDAMELLDQYDDGDLDGSVEYQKLQQVLDIISPTAAQMHRIGYFDEMNMRKLSTLDNGDILCVDELSIWKTIYVLTKDGEYVVIDQYFGLTQ